MCQLTRQRALRYIDVTHGRQRLPAMLMEPVPALEKREVEKRGAALTAHVLAVDDDPSVRKMIVDYLGDNEIRVTALASGREIAEVMARDTIDLVVLDLRMPGEDGMQIARRLREESQ